MTGALKHHRINQDLWRQLEAAKQIAAGNPNSSAPGEVRELARIQRDALRQALRRAHEQEQANASVSEIEEIIRRVFHRQLAPPLHMKDVVEELKVAAADADELLRQAEGSLRTVRE